MASRTQLFALLLTTLLIADVALSQTFTYSRGWKNGKRSLRASSGAAAAVVGQGHAVEDQAADDQPLYRLWLETRGDHRVGLPFERFVEEAPPRYVRRQRPLSLSTLVDPAGAAAAEHDE